MRRQTLFCVILALGSGLYAAADTTSAPLRREHPEVRFHYSGPQLARLYGAPFGSGVSPEHSAQGFVDTYSGVFGVAPDELVPGNTFNGRLTQPVMFDPTTGQSKFTLVYYRQMHDSVPVHGAELRILVRNTPEHPPVWAGSSVRALGNFAVPAGARSQIATAAAHAAVAAREPELRDFGSPETVIWAGVDDQLAPPRLAVTFVAAGTARDSAPQKWRFVCDAATGEILHDENLILFTDVSGQVSGMSTPGPKADHCSPEVVLPLPWARVTTAAGQTAYTDAAGHFTIANSGTTPVTLTSYMDGLHFYIEDYLSDPDTLSLSVTPPGPADFTHNAANVDEYLRAEVNAYVQANKVRDWILTQNAAYPGIAGAASLPVRVNLQGGYCPGNAWYDLTSFNFCAAGGVYANTAWQSVICHEYGHHVVQMGGSGQAAYGEGMSDCISMLMVDDPVLGYGFTGNCDAGIRNADNTFQYPCYGEIHACGQLISGCVWSTRNELALTEPQQYLSILSDLTVNSVLLHTGSLIDPSIATDFLTLDDDDGDLSNGTPHYTEITTGFAAHNMWGDTPQVALPVSLLAQWGGESYTVAVVGNLAYLGTGTSLVIVDISDTANPQAVGQLALPDLVHGVTIQGSRAYVAASTAGLRIVDVSDPAQPRLLGVFPTNKARDVVVSGDFAYVADNFNGFVVVDVSNPSAPFERGRCSTNADAFRLTLAGNYVYVAELYFGLQVIDVTDPAAPAVVGERMAGVGVSGVAIVPPYAYLSERSWGIEVVGASNPATPLHVSQCNTSGISMDVAAAGNRAYVADGEPGLQIINISNPLAPVVQTQFDTPGYAHSVALTGGRAFVADKFAGLQIINVANPDDPIGAGRYVHAGSAQALVVAGQYAYVANGDAGLQIADIANPSAPVCLSTYDTDGQVSGIALAGQYAHLATGDAGLQVFDVADPAAPSRVGGLLLPAKAWNLAIRGGYAYVADDTAGLQIIDITDPALPRSVGSFDTPGKTYAVVIDGNLAYLADGIGGLQIIDVTDPNVPVWVGAYDTPTPAYGLTIFAGRAYIADGFAGLQIVDISDPAHPAFVAQCPLPGDAWSVTLDGGYAYLATSSDGVQIVDVSDPLKPRWVGQYNTPGGAAAVAIAGYLFVADGNAGVAVLRLGRAGDMNCDGVVDIGDINPYIMRLASPAAYFATFPDCPTMNADINGDGESDLADINPFVNCIIHKGCP